MGKTAQKTKRTEGNTHIKTIAIDIWDLASKINDYEETSLRIHWRNKKRLIYFNYSGSEVCSYKMIEHEFLDVVYCDLDGPSSMCQIVKSENVSQPRIDYPTICKNSVSALVTEFTPGEGCEVELILE